MVEVSTVLLEDTQMPRLTLDDPPSHVFKHSTNVAQFGSNAVPWPSGADDLHKLFPPPPSSFNPDIAPWGSGYGPWGESPGSFGSFREMIEQQEESQKKSKGKSGKVRNGKHIPEANIEPPKSPLVPGTAFIPRPRRVRIVNLPEVSEEVYLS